MARARPHQPTEADIRTILDRLGDPTAIAAEASLGEPTGPDAASPPVVGSVGAAPDRRARRGTWENAAIALGFAFVIVAIGACVLTGLGVFLAS